jgi:hypothetical protein
MTLFLITLLIVGGLVAFAMLSGGNHKTDKEDTQSDDKVLANAVGFLAKTEALRQAEIAGNDIVKDAILSNTYTGPWPERRDDGGYLSIFDNLRILKVAGMNFRQGMNRYKGFIDAALVPEPKNEYDSNAIKVVAIDGHHLGYVPAEQTDFVRSLTANEFPYKCKCEVCEGLDYDDEKYYFGYLYIKRLD